MIIDNKKNNKFRLVKPAGIFNILHAVAALLFISLTFLDSFGVISFKTLFGIDDAGNITKNIAIYNLYMVFQLTVLVLGVIAAVYSIRAIQAEKQLVYYASFSIAGLNCTFLLFTGKITLFAIVNLITGIIMLRDSNSEEKRLSAMYNFGGSSASLNKNQSTASILENKSEK